MKIIKSKWQKMLIAALCGVCCHFQHAAAQSATSERNQKDYYFSSQILDSTTRDNHHITSWQFSFIGDYKKALQYADSSADKSPEVAKKDSVYFKTFTPVAANHYITEHAVRKQIIIINEAHHSPRHRVFTLSMLQDLYNCGYRYFGAETLSFTDTLLNQRKYPVRSSGWYSVEPQYGELIRQALKIGFQVFDYEARTIEAIQDSKAREINQASNIKAVLTKDPDAKILIHAGYDHIREDSIGGTWGKAMAGRLRELTGIDPFTINQEMMTERSAAAYENPYFRITDFNESCFFINDKKALFNGPMGATVRFDARLFHPKTKMIHGRPDWLYLNGKRKPYFITAQKSRITIPCLVFAYYHDEDYELAVPADVIEIKDSNAENTLVLFPGKYRIIIKSTNGTIQELTETIL